MEQRHKKWVWIGIGAVAGAGTVAVVLWGPFLPDGRRGNVPAATPGTTRVSPSSTDGDALPSLQPSLTGPVLAPGGPRAASGLASKPGCRDDDPTKGFVDLTWTAATHRGQEQRLQVSIFGSDFGKGSEVSEALASDAGIYRWERPAGQAKHHWRVLTRHPGGWTPSDTAIFRGPTCVGT